MQTNRTKHAEKVVAVDKISGVHNNSGDGSSGFNARPQNQNVPDEVDNIEDKDYTFLMLGGRGKSKDYQETVTGS